MMVYAIKAGITPSEYWSLTLKEIYAVFEAEELKRKEMVTMAYNSATMISSFTAYTQRGMALPPIEDLFSEIFRDKEEKRTQIIKEKFTDWALAFNAQRKLKNDP